MINIVVAERASEGMAHSVRAGLASMPEDVAGVIVLLADMPLVDAALVNTLIDAYAASDYAIVPAHGQQWGNPVLLSRAAMQDSQFIEGDNGTRWCLRANTSRVRAIPWDSRCHIDIDTEQALSNLAAYSSQMIVAVAN